MKGFIGPLGDDIPSIFPIIAGITLFIGAIIYANNEVDLRNSNLHLRQSGLELSYIALQKGFVTPASFTDSCEKLVKPTAQKNSVKFAIILRDCTQLDVMDPFAGTKICSNAEPGELATLADQKTAYSLFNYPVSTDCSVTGEARPGLGNVNIVSWYK